MLPIPWPLIGRLVLGKLVSDEKTKARVIAELREAAKDTENGIDDAAVDALEACWDVLFPVMLGKKP